MNRQKDKLKFCEQSFVVKMTDWKRSKHKLSIDTSLIHKEVFFTVILTCKGGGDKGLTTKKKEQALKKSLKKNVATNLEGGGGRATRKRTFFCGFPQTIDTLWPTEMLTRS